MGVYLFFASSATKLHFFLGVFFHFIIGADTEIVHEFIEKIVVSKSEKVDGQRYQRVDIHYNTIGLWTAPEPETLEREYLAYYNSMQKRKKKTA